MFNHRLSFLIFLSIALTTQEARFPEKNLRWETIANRFILVSMVRVMGAQAAAATVLVEGGLAVPLLLTGCIGQLESCPLGATTIGSLLFCIGA